MKEMKRILAIFLCLVMLVGVMPVSAFASEDLGGFVIPGTKTEVGDKAPAEETTAPAEEETTAPAEEETTAPSTEPATEPTVATEEVEEEEAEQLDADGVTYVLAGSDFQASSHDAGATIVSGLLDKIKADYPTMDGFLFAGDYDVSYSDSANGKAKLQETVQGVYGTGMHEIYVQGNHDGDSLVGSTLTASGANDAENYGVFVINEKDYMWYNDDEDTIKKTAENLESYLNAKRNAGYTKPIFVISHLPLHYCMRTRSGGNDGMHANYIFDVLNEAGNAGLNIIFMFGHNHSHGWDDYLGGAAIFLTHGNKINIAQNSTTVFEEETLAFTYMNAGYVGYYGTSYTSDVDKTLTMTTFEITDTTVKISRYDSNGTHDLKSAGVYNVEYPDNAYYSTDTTTVGTPYTLTLNTEITPAGEEIEGPDSGSTSSERTYTRVTSTSELVSGEQYLLIVNHDTVGFMTHDVITPETNRTGFDMAATSVAGGTTITGDYSQYEWTLTESTSAGWVISTNGSNVYFDNADGTRAHATLSTSKSTTFTIAETSDLFTFDGGTYAFDESSAGVINGYNKTPDTAFYIYRLTNEGSSTPTVDTSGGKWVTITEPTEAGTRYVYELDTNGVDIGVEYLIVANSYPKALSAAASSNNAVDIEISGNYAYANSDTYGWTFTSYSNGVYYIRLNGSTYLALSNNALGSSSYAGSSRRWTVTSNGDGSYDIVRSGYNLRWSNSNGVFQASSSNEGPVRLYKYSKTETTTAQEGLYGKISGNLTYNVAIGTSAEAAVQAVKDGIDVLYHTGDESAAVTLTAEEENTLITWTLDSSYDGVTPGEYAVTIAYNGVTLGTAKVVVPTVNITGYAVNPSEGSVSKGASQAAQPGAEIVVQLENGKYYTVPVTVAMLTKADGSAVSTGTMGTYENLILTYNGVVITEHFTLHVVAKAGNNYPTYPNEGAVKVNKTGTGVNFQSTGIAQIEVSASGVPSRKGADVIVMLDLSSSMTNNVDGQTRLSVLEASLQSMMTQLKANGEDGQPMDIRIAVADFNHYYTDASSPYYINKNDHLINGSIRTNADGTNMVYTGSRALNAGAFVSVHDLAVNEFDGLTTQSGTNYDYAFDAIYQLGESITVQNATDGLERDLYVIFMSDGAPFQFNYFSAQSGTEGDTTDARYWNNWLTGTMTDAMFDSNARNDYYNENGKHWMAEAIKGNPAVTYPVIRKNNAADTDGDTWVNVSGLGAKMYSIGFCLARDKEITVASMDTVIKNIASEEKYYYRADSAKDLGAAFKEIGNDIAYAAYNARFVDQMGADYDLQLKPFVDVKGNAVDINGDGKQDTPSIEIVTYDIYTRQDFLNGTIEENQIGVRKGTSTVQETVTFSADGAEAYSSLIYTENDDGTKTYTNILISGVICAKYFWYNTTSASVAIDGVSIPTGTNSDGTTTGSTNVLPAETFYWKLGTVQTSELAMRYYVYLTDSMTGKEAGSYPTNEYATLYYDNYLENPCKKDTVSPVMGWESANVSYAFYLVNAFGQPVNNNGQVVPFANRVTVVQPTLAQEVLLNSEGAGVAPLKILANDPTILPAGYSLYDTGAVYEVVIKSDASGQWTITNTKNPDTTYVTDYSSTEQYTNKTSATEADGYQFHNTTVWFAVVWEPQAISDTVVIDFGLPVDVHVMMNDMFGDYGTLKGVKFGTVKENRDVNQAPNNSADGAFGNAQVILNTASPTESVIRYTLDKSNSMVMTKEEVFTYSVDYQNELVGLNDENGFYYGTLTVIPATTIYYEDDFITFETYKWDESITDEDKWVVNSNDNCWSVVGNKVENATQDEDRPDDVNYAFDTVIDANNIYGYDSAYNECSEYSLGAARKATVSSGRRGHASFTFYGTGFDVISLTSDQTGTIIVNVTGVDNDYSKSFVVNTYYGYMATYWNVTYTYQKGQWNVTSEEQTDTLGEVVDAPENPKQGETYTTAEIRWKPTNNSNGENALYQVPVIKVSGLTYGQYEAEIIAQYAVPFDPNKDGSYDFYLDAIRIYDPAGVVSGENNEVIEDAYAKDNEAYPVYQELRNCILDWDGDESFATDMAGLVFIDGIGETASVVNYAEYGPNNELYLQPGQAIVFTTDLINADNVDFADELASLQIGLKAETVTAPTYYIFDAATVKASADIANLKPATTATATDMYYDITDLADKTIVIYNHSGGILSITNLKATFTADSGLEEILSVVDSADVQSLLDALNDVSAASGNDNVMLEEVIRKIVGRLKGLFGKG